jgi:hypothetical protein
MLRPSHFTPGKETWYPLHRRFSGPHGWSGQVWKISPPPGFDPQTVQPVVSRYTDYTVPAQPCVHNFHFVLTVHSFVSQVKSPTKYSAFCHVYISLILVVVLYISHVLPKLLLFWHLCLAVFTVSVDGWRHCACH